MKGKRYSEYFGRVGTDLAHGRFCDEMEQFLQVFANTRSNLPDVTVERKRHIVENGRHRNDFLITCKDVGGSALAQIEIILDYHPFGGATSTMKLQSSAAMMSLTGRDSYAEHTIAKDAFVKAADDRLNGKYFKRTSIDSFRISLPSLFHEFPLNDFAKFLERFRLGIAPDHEPEGPPGDNLPPAASAALRIA